MRVTIILSECKYVSHTTHHKPKLKLFDTKFTCCIANFLNRTFDSCNKKHKFQIISPCMYCVLLDELICSTKLQENVDVIIKPVQLRNSKGRSNIRSHLPKYGSAVEYVTRFLPIVGSSCSNTQNCLPRHLICKRDCT